MIRKSITIGNNKLGSSFLSAHGRQNALGHALLAAGVPKERLHGKKSLFELSLGEEDKLFDTFPDLTWDGADQLRTISENVVGEEKRKMIRKIGRQNGISFRFVKK